MWQCKYCGSSKGMYYKDNQLEGMLCLDPNCGRFSEHEDNEELYDSDL